MIYSVLELNIDPLTWDIFGAIDKYQLQRSLISVANHARVDGAICKALLPSLLGGFCLLDVCVLICPSEEASCLQSQWCFLITQSLVVFSSMSLPWFVLFLVSAHACDSMLV